MPLWPDFTANLSGVGKFIITIFRHVVSQGNAFPDSRVRV